MEACTEERKSLRSESEISVEVNDYDYDGKQ
jgi:hypothetical protein